LGEEPALKKRVCENCRFFQEAGFAKNGWCNNPLRKETSDVRLVVRRNELACRNGWAQDLWVLRTDDEAADIVLHDTIAVRPMPPASVEELTVLVNTQRDKSATPEPPPMIPPVDVVVGETPSTKPPAERQALLAQDPRTAILKARERHRARMAAQQRLGDQPPLLDDRVVGHFEVTGSNASVSPVRPERPSPSFTQRGPRAPEVPPVQISEVPRTFPTITSFPEDELRFSSVPEPVEGFLLPRSELKSRSRADIVPIAAVGEHQDEPEVPMSSATTFENPSDALTEASASPLLEHDRSQEEFDSQAEELLPIDVAEETTIHSGRSDRRRFELGGRRRKERPILVEEPAQVEFRSDQWIDELDVPLLPDDVVADINPEIEIAPDVPRMCRTCRDFRPADSGERGWCTNRWAFSHRRMVDADELPCETSIGCWWLPHDDVWMVTADVSAHSQPTPLVDHWLAHKVGLATTDNGEQRRRRRS
jgi:hypothetical protein